jgi:hypothetical protein
MVEERHVVYFLTGKALVPGGFRPLNLHKVLRRVRKSRHQEWKRTSILPVIIVNASLHRKKRWINDKVGETRV